MAEIAGLERGVSFVLFVRDGMLDFLEGFTFDEPWPDRIDDYAVDSADTLTPNDLHALDAAERRVR